MPPPRICCWPIPSQASIICLSSPNLPRSVSLRADQPVLVVHVVGQVRLLLRAMRGGLGFQRVDLPALVPLSLTGIWRAGGSLTGPDGAKLVVVPLSFGQRGGSCLWRWVFRAARFELRGGLRAGDRRQLAGGHCLLANPGGGSSGGGWRWRRSRWANYERAMEGPASGGRE